MAFGSYRLNSNSHKTTVKRICQSIPEVRQYLREQPINNCLGRLHILQGLSPQVCADIGDELSVDPRIFMRHQRTALRKIVASQYTLLGQYCAGLLSHLEWRMSRENSVHFLTVQSLEEHWSKLQAFRRHIEDYCHAIRPIKRNLQLSKPPSQRDDWRSSHEDLEDIQTMFDELAKRSESTMSSFAGLAGIVSSRRSLTEAETVGRLTILGMVFLPLSLVSGLFSMSDPYLPGAEHFWVYWAASIPIVVLILMVPLSMFQAKYWRTNLDENRQRILEWRWWEPKPRIKANQDPS